MRQVVEEVVRPAPTGRMPDEPTSRLDPADEEAVAPEEQQFYDTFMNKAVEYIHGPKSSRAVLKHLNQKDLSVPEAVGRTLAFITKNVVSSAKAAGAQVYPDAVFHAGQELTEELLDLGQRAQIFPIEPWPEDDNTEPSPEQQQLAQEAFTMATQFYGEDFLKTDEGKAVQGEAQAQVLRQIQSESKAGTLNPDFMVTDPNTVEGGVKRALFRSQAV